MATDWQGAASAAYGAQFDQLKPQVTKFIDLMTQINGQLKSAADQIEQNDQQLSKGFGFK
jgi:WXG100 family type VII secretion target